MATTSDVEREVGLYLGRVMESFGTDPEPAAAQSRSADELADAIFDLVTSRRFCYLGRSKAANYRDATRLLLRRRIESGEAFRFFYDIGPGYHASLRPGHEPLCFDVGLSELLILGQISLLARRVAELYPAGLRFWLVVDNLCGLRTNDIPVAATEEYCRQLDCLIEQVGLADHVDLIVESREFALADYDRLLTELEPRTVDADAVSPEAHENVERFLGRRCSRREAAGRIERYERTTVVTETLLDDLVRGVHMTQRATGATLGFRPYPGGDARTQCGQVVLGENGNGGLRPFLLTSRNAARFDCTRLEYPAILPPSVTHVTYAAPVSEEITAPRQSHEYSVAG